MRLGLMLGYAAGQMQLPIELVQEADRLGVHSVWTAEAYGSDAVSPLAWLGAQTTASSWARPSCRCPAAPRPTRP
jgi:alkanesulfonate monooxygenase SsuD/methylene tetrahydromethanopterin reductase-like flavin-dependent oxidoreductase (luciferase family)